MTKPPSVRIIIPEPLLEELHQLAKEEGITWYGMINFLLEHGVQRLRAQRENNPTIRFERWWFEEGRKVELLPGDNRFKYSKRATRLAWLAAQHHIPSNNDPR